MLCLGVKWKIYDRLSHQNTERKNNVALKPTKRQQNACNMFLLSGFFWSGTGSIVTLYRFLNQFKCGSNDSLWFSRNQLHLGGLPIQFRVFIFSLAGTGCCCCRFKIQYSSRSIFVVFSAAFTFSIRFSSIVSLFFFGTNDYMVSPMITVRIYYTNHNACRWSRWQHLNFMIGNYT